MSKLEERNFNNAVKCLSRNPDFSYGENKYGYYISFKNTSLAVGLNVHGFCSVVYAVLLTYNECMRGK